MFPKKIAVFALMALPLFFWVASAVEGASPPQKSVSCEIIGTVIGLQSVSLSPWQEGVPSALATYETHVSVSIENRKPRHAGKEEGQNVCVMTQAKEMHTYRLCSKTHLNRGDRIRATEGLNTGASQAMGCLFDLKVLTTRKDDSGHEDKGIPEYTGGE